MRSMQIQLWAMLIILLGFGILLSSFVAREITGAVRSQRPCACAHRDAGTAPHGVP